MFPRSPEHQDRARATPRAREVLLQEAKEFIDGYYRSMNRSDRLARWLVRGGEDGFSGHQESGVRFACVGCCST